MARPPSPPVPLRRDGMWYFIKRVPKAYASVDARVMVRISTGIPVRDDPRGVKARRIVQQINEDLEQQWRLASASGVPSGKGAFEAAIHRARTMGVTYRTVEELAALPTAELVEHISVLGDPTKQSDENVMTVLGGVQKPPILISDLPGQFESIDETTFSKKSDRQRHKWRVARETAVKSFIQALGDDRAISELSRQDVMTFRAALQARVRAGEINIETANTFIGRVGAMFKTVNEAHMLELPPLFANTKLKGAEPRQRRPYDIGFVQDSLLATGALDGLNLEARSIVYLVAETGLRLSEACNLSASTIDLKAAVPHIRVRAEGRQLKTAQSQRDIPLVGVALMAMREHPKGFPRYLDKADNLSAVVNKVLEGKGLRPHGESVYSLRHTFKDRLRAAGATDEMKDALMGHKRDEPAYGFGYSLETKAELLNRIAFKPPDRL